MQTFLLFLALAALSFAYAFINMLIFQDIKENKKELASILYMFIIGGIFGVIGLCLMPGGKTKQAKKVETNDVLIDLKN